ncbi:MAG: hypothetical protein JSV37_00480, partial [Anaerolineaceae bacterium]
MSSKIVGAFREPHLQHNKLIVWVYISCPTIILTRTAPRNGKPQGGQDGARAAPALPVSNGPYARSGIADGTGIQAEG